MSKHTPGPWIVTEEGNFVYALSPKGTNRFSCSIAPGYIQGYDSEEVQQANARLIAAAPDLFEACIKANKYLAKCASLGKMPDDTDYWAEVQQKLALAILKTGVKL